MMTMEVFSLNKDRLGSIEEKFKYKRKLANERERELFHIFDENLTLEEEYALKFLYAHMSLNDLADYNGELFLNHVRTTLEIRNQVKWGRIVSDHLFLHFVLPYRVNNENIDDSRGVLFAELAERVMNLSMYDAILETNYWCHEKATYLGRDARTVSPLTLIRTAYGRCGEEATLAVAALRSIGIPARQCYVPLWSHTDDNHAWVETWADGIWHYFGACEPEPVLNKSWFDAPAQRAMLVHARVPAQYTGPENITLSDRWHTELNVLDRYAPARTIKVIVMDRDEKHVQNAEVLFQVYNFAAFSPIAALKSDEQGIVTFHTGYGDLLLHASNGEWWGMKKINVNDGDIFEVFLDQCEQIDGTIDIDFVPPTERAIEVEVVAEDKQKEHERRVQEGAMIRKQFEDTFISEAQSAEIAERLALPKERVWNVLRCARGNSSEIASFLQEQTPAHGELPLRLLESLPEKDLTDTFRPTLEDHLYGSIQFIGCDDDDIFQQYIMCPRVEFEMLGAYRRFFQAQFPASLQEQFRRNPAQAAEWVANHIEVVENLVYYRGAATPAGTFHLKKGSIASRNIMFVALVRSLGIPARLEKTENKPQYQQNRSWVDARFDNELKECSEKQTGQLMLVKRGQFEEQQVQQYFQNITIARLTKGIYQTLCYPRDLDLFEKPIQLEAGAYRLTTGTRLKDGTVLTRLHCFTVKAEKTVTIPVTFRREFRDLPIMGKINPDIRLSLYNTDKLMSVGELSRNNGSVFAWIESDREPSKHLIRELGELSDIFNQLGTLGTHVVLVDERPTSDPSLNKGLPNNVLFVKDEGRSSLDKMRIQKADEMDTSRPLVFVLDKNCQIRYMNSGYKLGIGNETVHVLKCLEE